MDKKNILIILLCILTFGFSILFFMNKKLVEKEDIPPVTLTSKYYNTLTNIDFDKYSLDSLIEEYSSYSLDDDRWTLFDKVWQDYIYKSASMINKALTSKESFVLFYYVDDEQKSNMMEFVDRYKKENNIYIYKVDDSVYKETSLYNYVKTYPSVIIIKDGNIYSYTDINNENDNKLYESYDEFKNWLDSYIRTTV